MTDSNVKAVGLLLREHWQGVADHLEAEMLELERRRDVLALQLRHAKTTIKEIEDHMDT